MDDTHHPANTAHADYEETELAADDVPLYTVTDNIIAGDHSLVHSFIFNDGIHILTIDTTFQTSTVVHMPCLLSTAVIITLDGHHFPSCEGAQAYL
jgi:hypothetical protein